MISACHYVQTVLYHARWACTVDHYICCIEPALNTSHHVHASSSWDELSILKIVYEADHYEQIVIVIVIVSASHVNLVKWQRNCDWEECDEPKAKVLFKKSLFIFVPWLNLYIYISGVKQLIMINHSFCLHNIWVLCIFIMYIKIHIHGCEYISEKYVMFIYSIYLFII